MRDIEEKIVLSFDELKKKIDEIKTFGKKVVWTNGCFDIIHAGHVTYLQKARKVGDFLVVGINSDDSVRKLKGQGRPIIPESQRILIVSALECVDYSIIFSDDTTVKILKYLQPNIYVKGGDYNLNTINQDERKVVESYNGKIIILPQIYDTSTTSIVNKINSK